MEVQLWKDWMWTVYDVCRLQTTAESRLVELTNRMWFSVVCIPTDNEYAHHSGQNVVDSRGAAEWVHHVMTLIVVDKSKD